MYSGYREVHTRARAVFNPSVHARPNADIACVSSCCSFVVIAPLRFPCETKSPLAEAGGRFRVRGGDGGESSSPSGNREGPAEIGWALSLSGRGAEI